MNFKCSDLVSWTSQSGGYEKTKTGEIVRIVPAHEPANVPQCGMPRVDVSYVVRVKNKDYWPLVSKLKLVKIGSGQ